MGKKYGEAALEAVRLIITGQVIVPRDAWHQATTKFFGHRTSSQEKGCPRDAFLGLCSEGLVARIDAGSYTRSKKNKQYAIKAAHLLKHHPELATNPNKLWSAVIGSSTKQHNQQMDVVISLWKQGLIQL